jgi:hemerythrin-like metal-binding protein
MTPLLWKDIYSVGVPELDQQHQRLLEIINELIEEQRDSYNAEKFSLAISELTHYAYTHFAAEERLLKAAKFPDMKDHVLSHVDFIMKMMGLALKVEKGSDEDRKELLRYLRDWYAGHVLGIDRFFIPYVTSAKLPKHV